MKKNVIQPQSVVKVDKPIPITGDVSGQLIETSSFINAPLARNRYQVSGKGLTVAVLDTGLRVTHVDFKNRVIAQRNFTNDNSGNINNAADGNGHGTNVTGIIAANRTNIGIAPDANIIPLKVLTNDGGGSFVSINKALEWILANQDRYNISVVNLSLGDGGNYINDAAFINDSLRQNVIKLTKLGIAVVIAAGNDYYSNNSNQGMGYPAIIRECVSVGAVYDANEGRFSYGDGSIAYASAPGQITPFSQRLHEAVGGLYRTDIFAPGAPITSSGHTSDTASSIQQGTSQASPVTAGVILLMQQLYQQLRNSSPDISTLPVLPPVNLLVEWMRNGAVEIKDGDDENDNVVNTNLIFKRIDAYQSLRQVRKYFVRSMAFDTKGIKNNNVALV